MQVTDKTIEVLKNFSTINSGIVLQQGKQQITVSPDDAIFAVAQLDEFPTELGIYELPNFITNLSLLESPVLEFTENSVKFTDKDGFNLTYRGCSPEIIHTPDAKLVDLKLDAPDVELNLTLTQLQKLTKVAAVNTFSHLTVVGQAGKLSVKESDRASDTSNTGVMELGDYAGTDFEAVFKVEQLKIIPQNYNVKIKKDAFAIFENADASLKYIIGLETKKKGKA